MGSGLLLRRLEQTLTGRFVARGTRPGEATTEIVSFGVTLIWCSLLNVCCRRPHSVSGTRRPIRHMAVTVFVFLDLASYVVVTTYDTRPTRTIGMTDV